MGLINRSKVKKISLDFANGKVIPDKSTDSGGREWDMSRCNKLRDKTQFTQVSKEFLDGIEADLKNLIKQKIKKIPMVGKTLK